jgi:hypothetical protein
VYQLIAQYASDYHNYELAEDVLSRNTTCPVAQGTMKDDKDSRAVRAELSRSMNGSKGLHFDPPLADANGTMSVFVAMLRSGIEAIHESPHEDILIHPIDARRVEQLNYKAWLANLVLR